MFECPICGSYMDGEHPCSVCATRRANETGYCKICGREVLRSELESIDDVGGVFLGRICIDPKCRKKIESYPCMREGFYRNGRTAAGEWL